MNEYLIDLHFVGFCLFSVSNFAFAFHFFHLKKLKIIQYNFCTGARKEMQW